jgi:signal transduction histidine kinase
MSLISDADKSSHLIEQASRSDDQAIRATQHAATGAVDSVRNTSHPLRVKAELASDTRVAALADKVRQVTRSRTADNRSTNSH